MKKILVLLCIIFLVGCAAPKEEPSVPSVPDENIQPEIEDEEVIEKSIAPAPIAIEEEVPPTPAISPELQVLLDKADDKIKNIVGRSGGYAFLYAPPPDNLARDRWYVKGDKIRVELYEENVIQYDINYDTLYIDTSAKTVVAYCEDERSPRCPDPDKVFYPEYDDVMILTPYQWLKEIPGGEIVGSEMLWDRKIQVVSYEVDDVYYKQWLDIFSGLSVKVLIEAPGEDRVEYQFRDLAINTVTDDMLEH